jgi:hypothetical protein
MDNYVVLIVDDEKRLVDTLAGECSKIRGVTVLKAYAVDDALKLIDSRFVHLALIDMEFQGRADGNRLFRRLADSRPSCVSLLLTRHPEEYRAEFFSLLDPLAPTISGAIDKVDFKKTWNHIVAAKASEWLENVISVNGTAVITEHLKTKFRSAVALTADEVDFTVSRLFGQGMRRVESQQVSLSSIDLEEMRGGRSTSVVLRARPSTAGGGFGIWTVIKLSPRADAVEEFDRYNRFVRFLVSLDARVELLGFISADTIGAICYSFAGRSPTSVCSLRDLFVEASKRTSTVLNAMFGPDSQCWYKIEGEPATVQAFFRDAYALDPPHLLQRIKKILQDVKNSVADVRADREDLIWRSHRICSPAVAIGSNALRTPYATCVVHGDMNANNIIVAQDNRVIMIDYRHTAFGPRALDFAALECSLRLDSTEENATIESVLSTIKEEMSLWKRVWRTPSAKTSRDGGRADSTEPFWIQISSQLAGHARSNFPTLTEVEYATTCFAWGLRVIRVQGLTSTQRLRIIIWISSLCPILDKS